MTTGRTPAGNSTLAIGGVSSPLDSFVVAESSVLRTNFCAKSPPIANLQNVSHNYKTTMRQIDILIILVLICNLLNTPIFK